MELSRDELISKLRHIDAYEFERFIGDIWEQRGRNTTVTSGSNDRGIDIIAEQHNPFYQKHLIQAKRYSAGNKIGSPDIQQYSSLQHQENNVDAVIIVTTSSFSTEAKQAANDLNVKLVSADELYDIISKLDNQKFLSNYIQLEQNQYKQNKLPVEIMS